MNIYDDVKNMLLEYLHDAPMHSYLPPAADLPHEIFNRKQTYIYYRDAERALGGLSTWECIGVVRRYEQENFGEVHTDLSDAVAVANMLLYILGGEVIHAMFADTESFEKDRGLTVGECNELHALAVEWFDENPDGVEKLFSTLV